MSTWGETALRRWALAGFGFVVLLAVVNPLVGSGLENEPERAHPGPVEDLGDSVYCLLMALSGLLILWYRPRHRVGWLLILVGTLEGLCTFGQSYGARALSRPEDGLPLGEWALALSAPLWIPSAFSLVTFVLLRYPAGSLSGRWAPRVERALVLGFTVLYVGYAITDASVTDEIPAGSSPIPLPEALGGALLGTGAVVVLAGTAFCFLHTALRTWRAQYPERQQLAWLVTVAPISVFALFLPYEGLQKAFYLIPLAIVVGVLRYRLDGIQVVVRRTLLYGLLTGLVLLVFVAATAGLSSAFPDGGTPEVLAAGLVAVGVVPVRDRLQRGVDRLVYGDRRDPLAALTRLGDPVGLTEHASLLPEVLAGVASALRVPGAEIVGTSGTRAVVGFVPRDTLDVPLVMGGQGVGVLRLAPRSGEGHLPAADLKLVRGLAPLVAAVLHSVELAEALRVEQERVVAATETERARLRQELHDGLGPSLTGIGLGLEALEARVGASDLVTRLRAETTSSLDEVRRIIDGLRPGALESADLLALLRIRAQHLSATSPVRVTVVAPDRLPVLPPEAEGAALRIVEEALTNVIRHASATTCVVTVRLDDALRLEIRDDGRGYDGPRAGGVGVASMCNRAEQLGGSCQVAGDAGGTTVSAVLPVTAIPETLSRAEAS
jgi:signal transduction histidine kinase